MKTMKIRIITKAVLIVVVLLIVPMLASAMGNSEKPYGKALEEEVIEIAEALEADEISKAEAIDLLHAFRADNGKEDNEDYQAMERLLTAVQTKEMTVARVREQIRELEECQAEDPVQSRDQLRTKEADEPGSGSTAEDKPESSGSGGGNADKAKNKK